MNPYYRPRHRVGSPIPLRRNHRRAKSTPSGATFALVLLAAIGLPGWAAASPGEPIPGDGSLVLGLLGYALPLIVVALALAILVVTERLTRRWRAAR